MRRSRRAVGELFDNPILVGTVTILVVIVAVYLSYIAENGLPFVPTYSVNVDVTNASELVKNADVRIGGDRVGQVLTITPEPANRQYPHPYARLGLALQKSLEPLPVDTKYQVRLASILGGVLTVALLAVRRYPLPEMLARIPWALRLHAPETGIPYGIALALAALVVLPHAQIMVWAFSG